MSKSANAGELRTPVYFKRITRVTDTDGFPSESEVNIFGENSDVLVKWVNIHGSEVFNALQTGIKEPATLTTRYHPEITNDLIVYKGTDPKPYEIISIDNVESRNTWLEIKVMRKSPAR